MKKVKIQICSDCNHCAVMKDAIRGVAPFYCNKRGKFMQRKEVMSSNHCALYLSEGIR